MNDEALPIGEMALASTVSEGVRALRFGAFEFDLHRGELRDANGSPIPLRPKPIVLLRYMLACPGRLLGRGELLAAVWPSVVVTDDSLVQCISELRLALRDQSQQLIRTVPRRGYRFEATVEPVEYAIEPVEHPVAPVPPKVVPSPDSGLDVADGGDGARPRSMISLAVVGALLLAAVVVALVGHFSGVFAPPVRIDEAITERHVIAVMPFTTSRDETGLIRAAEVLSDIVAEQIARRPGFRALPRAATSLFEGPPYDLRQIGRSLRATYLLTGRVGERMDAAGVVLESQLIRIDSGALVWSSRITPGAVDELRANDAGMQVASAIRHRLGELDALQIAASGRPADAAELTLLAWRDLERGLRTRPVLALAEQRFRDALKVDADSAIAAQGLAATLLSLQFRSTGNALNGARAAELRQIVDRLLRRNPEDATALLIWGRLQMLAGRYDLSQQALDKVNRLVPSYPVVHLMLAEAKLMTGRLQDVDASAERAIALGAGDPMRVSKALSVAAQAALLRGDDQRAYDLARRAIAEHNRNARPYALLAAIDGLAARDALAASELQSYLELSPDASIATFDWPLSPMDPDYTAVRGRLLEGLRRAGLPESPGVDSPATAASQGGGPMSPIADFTPAR